MKANFSIAMSPRVPPLNFYTENDTAWIDIKSRWNDGDPTGWEWINNGKNFLWVCEKDGWRHIYLISRDGKKETLVTKGNYDIANIKCIDEKNNYVYFMASPNNATQLYLYRVKMDGKGILELVSPQMKKARMSITFLLMQNLLCILFPTIKLLMLAENGFLYLIIKLWMKEKVLQKHMRMMKITMLNTLK